MAGRSGHNLKIAKSKLGSPRMPFECCDAGDGYARSGPVVTYRLSPEELAKYGPVARKSTFQPRRLTRDYLAKLLATLTVGQVAERWRVPQKLIFELVDKYNLRLDDKNRLAVGDEIPGREGEPVSEPVSEYEIYNKDAGDGGMAPRDKARLARAALPKEELEKLIYEMSDREIAEIKGLSYSQVFRLKKEYGLVGLIAPGGSGGRKIRKRGGCENMVDTQTHAPAPVGDAKNGALERGPEVPEKESGALAKEIEALKKDLAALNKGPETLAKEPCICNEPGTVTITEAIALYGGLEEEVDYLDWLLDPGQDTPPAGIIRLLDSRRCESARRLKRIRDVFDSVRVDIGSVGPEAEGRECQNIRD